jgi:hypothetical protein
MSLRFESFARVEQAPPRWLVADRIPFGALSLIVGPKGEGKTWAGLDLIARHVTGRPQPCGTLSPIGAALVIATEDSPRTLRRRLALLGADLHLVQRVISDGLADLSDPGQVADLAEHMKAEGVGILFVDMLPAVLGAVESHNDMQVKRALAPLCKLAADSDAAVIGTMHTNKAVDRSALARVNGSGAFAGSARSVVSVVRDGDRRVLSLLVCNEVEELPPSLAFTVEAGRVVWSSETLVAFDVDAALDAKLRSKRPARKVDLDAELRSILEGGPVPAQLAIAKLVALGASERTAQRAAQRVGARASRPGPGAMWALPNLVTATPPDPPEGNGGGHSRAASIVETPPSRRQDVAGTFGGHLVEKNAAEPLP